MDMKKQFVYDPLISKRQQYLLATQLPVVRAVLKIGQSLVPTDGRLPCSRDFVDDVIISGQSE
ncbi:hypothetical protein DFH94DRAFT_699805 [Russula ochroleuca]|uniref:Uncharacterized protein n=1 Tax=Russula ochroleuca TaxID=152965 RepID=A0A9P5JU55_9AGAM|nr:hypothetical protein DFH94DRAFT_699805 [Russula ochroleuca]